MATFFFFVKRSILLIYYIYREELKMETAKGQLIENKRLGDFLYQNTPTYSTWIIRQSGWRVATLFVDDEDLWTRYFSPELYKKIMKSYDYNKETNTGNIDF